MRSKDHWNAIYGRKPEPEMSWHQDDPAVSLALMYVAGLTTRSSVIDIGGGTSRLVDRLLALGVRDLTVLDVSDAALGLARTRLGNAGAAVAWMAADVTIWEPRRTYDIWHDRAVFHFLVDPASRASYLTRLGRSLPVGGHAIIATFAPDGPESCSGLPVTRYSPETLSHLLGPRFSLVAHRDHVHRTPWGSPQSFQYSLLRKTG